MAVLVVSPHLDDAVFSVGAWIAGQSDVVIATVFAGIPAPDVEASWWDRAFDSGAAAVEARRDEDRAACRVLGARWWHGPFLDGPYAGEHRFEDTVDDIAGWLRCVAGDVSAELLVVPLGIHHLDHVTTAAACWRVAGERIIYAERPYLVTHAEEMPIVDRELLEVGNPFASPREFLRQVTKARAVSAYGSQLPLVSREVTGPEMLWRY